MGSTWTNVIALFVIISAFVQPMMLRQRRIPHRDLWVPEPGPWRWAQRLATGLFGFAVAAHVMSWFQGFGGRASLAGIPLVAWAVVVMEIYLWLRCSYLIRSKRDL